MCTQLTIKSGNPNFEHFPHLMSTNSMLYLIHLVCIKGTQGSEMLTCYREDFLQWPLELQLCGLSVHLRTRHGKNTVHLGGIIKGNLPRGTSSLCLLCLDDHHHHSIPNRLCVGLLQHTGLRARENRITYVQNSESSLKG